MMDDSCHSPPNQGYHHLFSEVFRSLAARGKPRGVSRIPTMRGSLFGPSGRFAQRFQSDYGWNQSFDIRAEAHRARNSGELPLDYFDSKDPVRHLDIFIHAPWWNCRLVYVEVE